MSPQVTDLAPLFRSAADLIAANGHHQGDYIPDPFNRVLHALPHERPMSMVAALRCAEQGHPQRFGPKSTAAIEFLADRLPVNDEPPYWRDEMSLECHVAAWGDVVGREVEEVVEQLLLAAQAVEAVHAAVVPVHLVTSDGTEWELSSIPAEGEPQYVVAGVHDAPASMFAGLGELAFRFGAVLGGAA
ncbi:hypothetical protein ACFV3E_24815 [Streptomyces sp. NPDC059718]